MKSSADSGSAPRLIKAGSVTAMLTAIQQLEENLTAIEAAQIEVLPKPKGSGKEPTPPPN